MELTAGEAWSRILESAKAQLPEQSYRTWLAPTSGVGLSNDTLIVSAPSDFAVEWIEDKYGDVLSELTRRVLGSDFSLTFEPRRGAQGVGPAFPSPSTSELDEPGPPSPGGPEPPGSGRPTDCVVGTLNPRYTIDRFVVGSNSQLATAACQAVAAAPGRAYNPLFLHGGVGLGKTHLMHAIGHAVLEEGARVAYVPTEQFMNELIAAIQSRSTPEFRRRYRRIDVLLVDDVHFLAGKEGTQEEFFHTFNALYDAQKQIVVSSDRPPKEIPGLQERLVSRFEWGLVTDIKPPDFETRVAILQQKAEEDGLSIAHDVLAYIADHCRSSVRELEGAVIKLLAYSSLTRREIDTELAREALGKGLRGRGDLTARTVQEAVCELYGISVEQLNSRRRTREVTLPRQVAMYLVKELIDLPYSEIGRLFGDRDHSTVIHSVRKIEQAQKADAELAGDLETLRRELA